jgi:hypothetical protein
MAVTFSLAAIMSGLCCSGQALATGTIKGFVRDDNGTAVPHAMAIAYLRYSASGSTSPQMTIAESNSDGSYLLTGLQPGSYLVCAQAEGRALLNPCEWLDKPPAWNLSPGGTAVVTVTMPRGTFLHFRVSDVDGELKKKRVQGREGKRYEVGLWTRRQSLLRPEVLASDDGGENLRVAVPFNSDVRYSAAGGDVRLTDVSGKEPGWDAPGNRELVRLGTAERVVELKALKKDK